MKKMVRQGDILLVRVNTLPETIEVKLERVILAYGEATGHAHVVDKAKALVHGLIVEGDSRQIWDAAAERYIQVLEKTTLRHIDARDAPTGEHADIELTPGNYRVIRQREWTNDDETRLVSD